MRLIAIFVALLLVQPALAQVYRWVDEDGVVHYTDRPVEGAEVVDLPESEGTEFRRPASVRPTEPAATGEEPDDQGFSYESFRIAQPSDEETLWNIGATLDVSLSLAPGLREGHEIEVWFDGSVVESREPASLSFAIPEVYRGTHNLWARVLDSSGRVLIQSNEVTFYVQQTSVINPP
jgi:hypothetical protein